MKATILILVLFFPASMAQATVLTLSDAANSPGQYTDLNNAIAAASSGDTLYMHGSPIDYTTVAVTLNKPLTIIGAGGLPNKNFSFPTKLSALILGTSGIGGTTASGTKIIGCEITALTLNAGNYSTIPGISDVTITRCKITNIYFNQGATTSALAHNNILFYNNVIYNITGSGGNGKIRNCVFKNNILWWVTGLGDEFLGSWILSNNVILYGVTNNRSAVISNNIFYNTLSTSCLASNNYCSVSNNSIVSTAHAYTAADIIYGTNTGGNNLLNQDPLFVSYTTTTTVLYNYSQTQPSAAPFTNFNLQPSSLCLLFGTDGTDIGIYGGSSPFVEGYPDNTRYRYFPMPAIPQMLDMNIMNATIVPAGTLNVNFKARKQD
ncbi:MAG: right-handed parallel beta-helix repeat-containing protein [Bacteroidetes bacterium]|nr:right-handed parallel beta-helix repeat-containing protein [Bacteroidota bacterium]